MTTPVKSKAKKPKRYVYTLLLPVKNKQGKKERLLKVSGVIVSTFGGWTLAETKNTYPRNSNPRPKKGSRRNRG